MSKSVYDIIKKQNGENFAQKIRNYDSGIFEVPDLEQIIQFAGKDATPLLPYLESLKYQNRLRQKRYPVESLDELLTKAGYRYIVADTLEKQNSIRKYFVPKEEICSFKDETRFERYYILHLIKEGAEFLKREDFISPKREDEYGSSVMSIQILKQGGFIKITNRYNHTVQNPDNTFNSNPDKIIEGLSQAIKDYFSVDFDVAFPCVPENYLLLNGLIYQIHTECNNVYFGEDFYIQDEKVSFINKDYQMIIDNFILDFKKNEMKLVHEPNGAFFPEDELIQHIQDEIKGKKLTRKRKGNTSFVYADDLCILKSVAGSMTYLDLPNLKKASTLFVHHQSIEEIKLENLVSCDDMYGPSFTRCPRLKKIYLPKLKVLRQSSISHLGSLEELDLSSVTLIQNECLNKIGKVRELYFPMLELVDNFCLNRNNYLRKISFPKVLEIGRYSLSGLKSLKEVFLPAVKKLSDYNLSGCSALEEVELLEAEFFEIGVLSKNRKLKKVHTPKLYEIGNWAFTENPELEVIRLQKLRKAGEHCFRNNSRLKKLYLPSLLDLGARSVVLNQMLEVVSMPRLRSLGMDTFFSNPNLRWVFLNSLKKGHCNCFFSSGRIEKVYAPEWKDAGKILVLSNKNVQFLKSREKMRVKE